MKKAIYPGSFDPLTNGHLNIIKRASNMFDEVVVAIGNNSKKNGMFTPKERLALIEECIKPFSNVSAKLYDSLTVDFMKEQSSNIIIRGIRDTKDFEYEQEIANLNEMMDSNIETVLLFANHDFELISSTNVKEIHSFGGDISKFVPAPVEKAMRENH